jgi:uncharacterized membrane protein
MILERTPIALTLAALIAGGGYKKKSLSFSGFIAAFVVGFQATLLGSRFAATVILFFITSSLLTKYKSNIKKQLEHDFKEGGQRDWIQVMSNSLPAALMLLGFYYQSGADDHYLGESE